MPKLEAIFSLKKNNMKKVITFCVFGSNVIYQKGAVYNAELASKIYPDWMCRFYLFKECHFLKNELEIFNNVELILVPKEGNFYSTMYRFLPLGENNVSYFISRDTDSRISIREKEAVDEWVLSGKNFHIMKDHPYHYDYYNPVLAGMWGGRGGLVSDIQTKIIDFINSESDFKGIDQKFLYTMYENFISKDCCIHDSNFPSPRNHTRDGLYFIGQPFDENNNFYGDWENDLKLLNT
jgi:hypothetical protein